METTNFAQRCLRAEIAYEDSLSNASLLIGLPENLIIDNVAALDCALSYEQDIMFAAKNTDGVGGNKLGMEIPSTALATPIAQKALSKAKSRLLGARDEQVQIQVLRDAQIPMLKQLLPQAEASVYQKAASAVLWLKTAEYLDLGLYNMELSVQRVLNSLVKDDRLNFAFFVCPNLDYTFLSGPYPDEFVRSRVDGSLLSRQMPILKQLFSDLQALGIESSCQVFIGDDDEDRYITPASARLKELFGSCDAQLLEEKRVQFGNNVTQALDTIPAKSVEVYRLSQLGYESSLTEDVPVGDTQAEKERMRQLWNTFYMGLPTPTEEELEIMVNNKFETYAGQGKLIQSLNPNTILIQTEMPFLLRTRMINNNLTPEQQIPAIYPKFR